jgi:hypothetical protein
MRALQCSLIRHFEDVNWPELVKGGAHDDVEYLAVHSSAKLVF